MVLGFFRRDGTETGDGERKKREGLPARKVIYVLFPIFAIAAILIIAMKQSMPPEVAFSFAALQWNEVLLRSAPWLGGLFLAYFFIYAFTDPLGDDNGIGAATGEGEPNQKEVWEHEQREFLKFLLPLRVSYLFMIFAICGSILPFALLDRSHIDPGIRDTHESPFQLLVGCVEGMPDEGAISCGNEAAQRQWLVSLGAGIVNRIEHATYEAMEDLLLQLSRLETSVAELATSDTGPAHLLSKVIETEIRLAWVEDALAEWERRVAGNDALPDRRRETVEIIRQFRSIAEIELGNIRTQTADFADELKALVVEGSLQVAAASEGGVGGQEAMAALAETRETTEEDVRNDLMEKWNAAVAESIRVSSDLLRTEGVRKLHHAMVAFSGGLSDEDRTIRVTGGLVVPLFVVVLSLLGGSISMTRRLPEIQKRAAPAYRRVYFKNCPGDEADKARKHWQMPISAVEGRDLLMFQILQVLTAPFLAIIVYASIEPESTAAAVLIGFGAGFASEPLLLKLRQGLDAIAPPEDEFMARRGNGKPGGTKTGGEDGAGGQSQNGGAGAGDTGATDGQTQ